MKIKNIEEIASADKFKNKEAFCNRIIQEVITITKNNLLTKNNSKKISDLNDHKKDLTIKNIKLEDLLKKSSIMQKDLIEKTRILVEDNNRYRDKLLELLETNNNLKK